MTVSTSASKDMKIILPGGAGLVGQNLVAELKHQGYTNLVVLDKHRHNLEVLKAQHPDITIEYADLAKTGEWTQHFIGANVVVMLQAQIGGPDEKEFTANNVTSTTHILNEIKSNNIAYTVHISSSVVKSAADDFYTRSKERQEKLVIESGIDCCILRPTLMFGWFDRKHLGWLSRFMNKAPVFPIPGHGRYMRQPLYALDFCRIIISCIEKRITGKIYNISGLEKVDYVDIIRQIKKNTGASAIILHIPYQIFRSLLWIWSLFDKKPPFTTSQLAALITPDEFEMIDWPNIFAIQQTPFNQALDETFNHPQYSKVVLEF